VIPVWDALVRSLHWLLAASVLTAWASGHWLGHWFDAVHHTAGHLAAAVVVVRLVWGVAGTPYARFSQFVRSPGDTWAYVRQLRTGGEPRHIGHNPLGGWMVVALLASVAGASLSGLLGTTDWLWGEAWVTGLHAALGWLIAGLVAGHIGGVAFTSLRHRENLVAAMVHGRKHAALGHGADLGIDPASSQAPSQSARR